MFIVQLCAWRLQLSLGAASVLAWCAVYTDVLTALFLFLVRDEGSWKVGR